MNTAQVDLSSTQAGGRPLEAAKPADEKWPLWWTVIGVVTFCSAVWATLFSLVF